MRRTALVTALLALMVAAAFAVASAASRSDGSAYPVAAPGVELAFPRDHGAHPDFRTEWWYVTGWLTVGDGPKAGQRLGFQVTFFRTRPDVDEGNPSAFSPSQVLFAHAALSDPAIGHLLHGERAARQGFGIAQAATADADVTLSDWHFRRLPDGRFVTDVKADGFAFALTFDPAQDVLPQGIDGYSRKGPDPADASVYYSLPHLAVSGTVTRGGSDAAVTGKAWLDREWASSYLAEGAVGWDWTGLNLDDGGALMAFRIRGATGDTVWAGGSLRRADGSIVRFEPGDVSFETVKRWTSPRTDAAYPVEQVLTVRLPEGERRFALKPLFDDQELDGRSGGLPVYWEGAVTTTGGRGYLELTGYADRLRM